MLSSCNEIITLKEMVLCLEKNKSEKLKWLQTYRSVRPWIIVVWGEGGPVVSLHDDLRFWDRVTD